MTAMAFTGYPKETLAFLAGLRRHNTKAWFDEHRGDYERYFLEPARAFVVAAHLALRAIAKDVRGEPRVNGSIFRVNRDIRFTKDKRPYKDHLDLWFWEGDDRRAAVSGFFLRVLPDMVIPGVGAHGFERDTLDAYRKKVVHAKSGPALVKAVNAVERAGYRVQGATDKTLPRGFRAEGPAARLLLHGALWAGSEEPTPAALHRAGFVDYCLGHWRKQLPVHRWLVDELQR